MWLAKKLIELVCSGSLAQAAQEYTEELDRVSRERGGEESGQRPGVSARERELRRAFMEAARREMGYAGEPLQRLARDEAAKSEASDRANLEASRQ